MSPIRCNNLSSRYVTAKYPKQHTLPYKIRTLLKVHLVFATLLSETSLYQTMYNDPNNRGVMKQTVWILKFRLNKRDSLHKWMLGRKALCIAGTMWTDSNQHEVHAWRFPETRHIFSTAIKDVRCLLKMINYVRTIGFNVTDVSKPITSVVNRDDDVIVTTERLNRSRKHSCVTLMTPLKLILLRF